MRLRYRILNPMGWTEVDPEREIPQGYGFESPAPDNEWIYQHCGIRVWRSWIAHSGDVCLAFFEPDDLSGLELRSYTAPWVGRITHYLEWAKTVLKSAGYLVTDVEQIKNAYVSTVFRVTSNQRTFYLKITSSVYVNNAALERELTEAFGTVPQFVAVSPDGYAALTQEMPGEDAAPGDPVQYRRWLERWAARQVQTVGEHSYHLPDCSPQAMLSAMPQFTAKVCDIYAAMGRSFEFRTEFNEKLRLAEESLICLCNCEIPNAVCHADIRPGNVRRMETQDALYDWGLAFYGHPFYDVLHFLRVVRRHVTEEQMRCIADAYLSQWTKYAGKDSLRAAYTQAEACLGYFMLTTDCRWVSDIIDACGGRPLAESLDEWALQSRFASFDKVLRRFVEV